MNSQLSKLSKCIRFVTMSSLAASITAVPAVMAQESGENADASVEKIAVVGTRSAPRSVGESAVPVDIISEEEFRNQGSTDMVSMMQAAVPSFNVNEQPINDASTLVRPANLRGMASDHTLVLLNGKRRHRSSVITFLGGGLSDGAQGPDISVIPSIALKQVEVLRDGAAAQYGSDAIAGVINFALKDDSEGGSLEARYGSYYEGDGDMMMLSGNIGLPFTKDGFLNLSYEYRESDDTSRSVQRDDAAALISGGNTHVADPAQIWGNPEVSGDIKFVFNGGIELNNTDSAYFFGNYAEREVDGGFYFRNPHTRGGVYDGGTNENGEQLLLVADVTGDMSGNCPTDIVVGENVLDNPRYQSEVANNPDCFAFNEMFPGGFTPRFGGKIQDASIVVGTKGEFGDEINYDISAYVGMNEVDFAIRNTINPSLGPDTPTEFKPGRYIQSEQSFNIDLNKSFEVGMAEPLFLAGGLEYRNESYESIAGDAKSYEVGPYAAQGFGIGSNGFPGLNAKFQGKESRNSVAMYLDSEMYLTEDLMVGAAIRFEDFSDFGNTTKGKLSARWQVTEDWALRGAVATGFKAPTIGQSNVRNVTTAFAPGGLQDQATLPPTDPIAQQKGATPLQPEESTSFSFGLVGQLDNGLFITMDYYNIELEDRLTTTSALALSQEDIDALIANGVTDASSFSSVKFFTNDFTTTTQGVDLVANYTMEMLGGDTVFSLAYNWTETEVDSVKATNVNNGSVREISPDQIGSIGADERVNINAARIEMIEDNLPGVRYSLTANHTNGDWRVMGRVNYFGGIYEDHLDSGGDLDIYLGSEVTVDLELGYTVNDSLTLVLGAKNAFDEYPDENTQWDTEVAGAQYPVTSPIGINGGFYYLRALYNF